MIEDIKIREQNRAARYRLRSTLIQELAVKLGTYVNVKLFPSHPYVRKYKKVIPQHVDNLLSRKRNITAADVSELERLIRGEETVRPATSRFPPAGNLDLSVSSFLSNYLFF
jgi:hypothetical protein